MTNPRGFHSIISETFAVLRPGQFLSIIGYHPNDGGEFNYTMTFRSSYHNVLKRSLDFLSSQKLENLIRDIPSGASFDSEDLTIAYSEVLESLQASLNKENIRGQGIRDAYTQVYDADKKAVEGVKLHKESKKLHLEGLLVRTIVVVPAPPQPAVKSKPLTLAKRHLNKMLPLSRWRQFQLTEGKFTEIRVEGLSLTPDESRWL